VAPDRSPTGTITVASLALSRSHLAVARRDGRPHVRDLESRHGTTVGGVPLHGEMPVGEGLELRLGGEVPCVVRPAAERPGAVVIEIGGVRHVAPLGPATLGVGRWSLARVNARAAPDGPTNAFVDWVELVTHDAPPAFANGLRFAPRITLLAGDAFRDEPGGDEVLRFPLPSGG
jgi:hypothetical protein